MTPKYSAQWWEKVAAQPQQTPPEENEPSTAISFGSSGESETQQLKIKRRKLVREKTA
jgi:hypothetical protein